MSIARYVFLIHLFLLCCSGCILAQDAYFVRFRDKGHSPYSLERPQEYLSERALERRLRQQIDIDSTDMPVTPAYLKQLTTAGGRVLYPLRWFNGAVVQADATAALAIAALPQVMSVERVWQVSGIKGTKSTQDVIASSLASYNYGSARQQIEQLGGHRLHQQGFTGAGYVIAVLDAGFMNVDVHPAFDSMRVAGRLLGTRDFVNPQSNIYAENPHGAQVLSTMAGLIPGQMVGTAPRAQYWLVRTEDEVSEQLIEEYNWIAGAELADSVGADVVNTSLGYNTFDDDSQSHSYADLNGQTTPITRGANMAASKGMLMVVSAGNEGSNSWRYIAAPADSPDVLTVGAIDSQGGVTFFSSRGPAADGRIKPDVCAMGYGATVMQPGTSGLTSASGTSFSGPIVAGLMACLWQAYPNLRPAELIDLVRSSASHYGKPNNDIGYGIPNFARAIGLSVPANVLDAEALTVFPNPTHNMVSARLPLAHTATVQVAIASPMGHLVHRQNLMANQGILQIELPSYMAQGVYMLSVAANGVTYVAKFIKL